MLDVPKKIELRIVLYVFLIVLILLLTVFSTWFFNKVYDDQQHTISNLTSENNYLQNQVNSLFENNSNLQFQLEDSQNDLEMALNLTKKVDIAACNTCPQTVGEKYGSGYFYAIYAGYVAISMTAQGLSNSGYEFIEVDYNYSGQTFNFTKTYNADPLGNPVGGTFIVPVLPTNIGVWIGNANSTTEPTIMYSLSYYY